MSNTTGKGRVAVEVEPNDGDVPVWDATQKLWLPQAIAGGDVSFDFQPVTLAAEVQAATDGPIEVSRLLGAFLIFRGVFLTTDNHGDADVIFTLPDGFTPTQQLLFAPPLNVYRWHLLPQPTWTRADIGDMSQASDSVMGFVAPSYPLCVNADGTVRWGYASSGYQGYGAVMDGVIIPITL